LAALACCHCGIKTVISWERLTNGQLTVGCRPIVQSWRQVIKTSRKFDGYAANNVSSLSIVRPLNDETVAVTQLSSRNLMTPDSRLDNSKHIWPLNLTFRRKSRCFSQAAGEVTANYMYLLRSPL